MRRLFVVILVIFAAIFFVGCGGPASYQPPESTSQEAVPQSDAPVPTTSASPNSQSEDFVARRLEQQAIDERAAWETLQGKPSLPWDQWAMRSSRACVAVDKGQAALLLMAHPAGLAARLDPVNGIGDKGAFFQREVLARAKEVRILVAKTLFAEQNSDNMEVCREDINFPNKRYSYALSFARPMDVAEEIATLLMGTYVEEGEVGFGPKELRAATLAKVRKVIRRNTDESTDRECLFAEYLRVFSPEELGLTEKEVKAAYCGS